MDNQYIKQIKYGNFYINILPALIPLVLWCFFIYKFYFPYMQMKPNTLLSNLPLFIILLIPFFFSLSPLRNKEMIDNTILSPVLYRACFEQPKKDLQEKGVLGIWDYECGASQVDYLGTLGFHISQRFYYVNYALLLFILVYGKIKSSKTITDHQIIFVSLTLLLGIVGTLTTSFTDNYNFSLMLMIMFGAILNMNIAAFLFTLVSFAF